MSKTRRIEFLQRLAYLLQEYNAEINFQCDPGSDLDGLSGECLMISMNNKEVYSPGELYIDHVDLQVELKKIKDAGEYL